MPSKLDSGRATNPTITPRLPNTTIPLLHALHTRTHNTTPTPIESFLTHHDLTLHAIFDAFDEIETSLSPQEFSAAAILDAGFSAPALTARTVYIIDTVMESLLQAGGSGANIGELLGYAGMESKRVRRRMEGRQNLESRNSGRRYACCSRIAAELTFNQSVPESPPPYELTVAELLDRFAQELVHALSGAEHPNPEQHLLWDTSNPGDSVNAESIPRHDSRLQRELHMREKKARNKKAKKQRVREEKVREQERREKEVGGQERGAQEFWQAPGETAVGEAAVGFERMADAHVRLQRTVDVVQVVVKRVQLERAERAKRMQEEREGWEEERKEIEVAQARARRNGQRAARLRREQEHRSWAILTKLEWGDLSDDEI